MINKNLFSSPVCIKVLCLIVPFALVYGIWHTMVTEEESSVSNDISMTKVDTSKTKPAQPNYMIQTAGHKSIGNNNALTKKTSTGNRAVAGTFEMDIQNNPIFKDLTVLQASKKFFEHVRNFTTTCVNKGRFGKPGDGGYAMCMDEKVAPTKNNCIIYSFGIRNEWSFDDAVHDQLGCEVHSFDPSMKAQDHQRKKKLFFHNLGIWDRTMTNDLGWKLASLQDIINMLGHQNKVIDYLKIDVEGAEWPMLKDMLNTNSPKNVKQMIFEIHTPKFKDTKMTVQDFGQIHKDLSGLQNKLGFKLWTERHTNGCCGRFATLTHKQILGGGNDLCCYELFYINKRFL